MEGAFNIKGKTVFEEPSDVDFDIYYNGTQLKASDYKMTLIQNGGKTYALILGKNNYAGYALIEVRFEKIPEANPEEAEDTVSEEPVEITCSNHLAITSRALSRFISTPKINVTPSKIKSLKRYKKAFKVKVAKKSSVSGYEIRYSRSKKMTNATVKNLGKATSKKINTNVRKKRFYVQVRTYKDVNGIRYYSSWSCELLDN